MTALDRLIEAVEAGTWDGSWRGVQDAVADIDSLAFSRAYHGTLDPALALQEALLPGWLWWGGYSQGVPMMNYGVWHPDAEWEVIDATDPIPARAWLLAILRAYRSVQA